MDMPAHPSANTPKQPLYFCNILYVLREQVDFAFPRSDTDFVCMNVVIVQTLHASIYVLHGQVDLAFPVCGAFMARARLHPEA